jgi:hypothetical protein
VESQLALCIRCKRTNCNSGILYIVMSWPVCEMDLIPFITHRRVPALCKNSHLRPGHLQPQNALASCCCEWLRARYHTPCAVYGAAPAKEWSERGSLEGEGHLRIFLPSEGGTVTRLLKGSET